MTAEIERLREERANFWGNEILQDQQSQIETLRANALTAEEATMLSTWRMDAWEETPLMAKLQRIAAQHQEAK